MPNHVADRIDYNNSFREMVRGQLKARFRLDSEGEPMWEPHPDDRRLRCYIIDMFLETPRAREIRGVAYYLNDPSYLAPEGYSDNGNNQFREEITSFSDVEIVVTVQMERGEYKQRARLSEMLENGHADEMTPAIRTALQLIKVN